MNWEITWKFNCSAIFIIIIVRRANIRIQSMPLSTPHTPFPRFITKLHLIDSFFSLPCKTRLAAEISSSCIDCTDSQSALVLLYSSSAHTQSVFYQWWWETWHDDMLLLFIAHTTTCSSELSKIDETKTEKLQKNCSKLLEFFILTLRFFSILSCHAQRWATANKFGPRRGWRSIALTNKKHIERMFVPFVFLSHIFPIFFVFRKCLVKCENCTTEREIFRWYEHHWSVFHRISISISGSEQTKKAAAKLRNCESFSYAPTPHHTPSDNRPAPCYPWWMWIFFLLSFEFEFPLHHCFSCCYNRCCAAKFQIDGVAGDLQTCAHRRLLSTINYFLIPEARFRCSDNKSWSCAIRSS